MASSVPSSLSRANRSAFLGTGLARCGPWDVCGCAVPSHDTPRGPVQTGRRRRGAGPQRGRAWLPGLAGGWTWVPRVVPLSGRTATGRRDPRRPGSVFTPFSGRVAVEATPSQRAAPGGRQPFGQQCPLGSPQQGRARAPRCTLTRPCPWRSGRGSLWCGCLCCGTYPEAVCRCPIKRQVLCLWDEKSV